jgi:hypothetical protein
VELITQEIPKPVPARTNSVFEVKKVKDVEVLERLGGGQFSDVYRGVWMV